jgi:hypothetical protein
MKKYMEIDEEEIYTCRICLDDENDANKLISPCRCSGSSKYVHLECLQTWRRTSRGGIGEKKCMECHTEYLIRKTHDRENIIEIPLCRLAQIIYYTPTLISMFIYIQDSDLSFITFLDGGKTYPLKKCETWVSKYNPSINNTYCYPTSVKGYAFMDTGGIIYGFYFAIILSIYSFLLISGSFLYQFKGLKNKLKFFKRYRYRDVFLHTILPLRMFPFYYLLRFEYAFICLMLSFASIPVEFCNINSSYIRYKQILNDMNVEIANDDTILTWCDNYIPGEGYDMIEIDEHSTSDEDEDYDDL